MHIFLFLGLLFIHSVLYFFFFIAVRAFGGSKYGPGNGDIFFRDTACAGTETGLGYCLSNDDTSECTHNDDAGIQCNGAAVLPTATPVQPTGPPPGLFLCFVQIIIQRRTLHEFQLC